MQKILLSLGLAALLAFPAASAVGGPIFCPPHNPGALTNACVSVNTTSRPVSHPYVNGFANVPICIISTLCVTAPLPTTGTTTTNVPGVTGSGTYVEATALCPYISRCGVSWSDVERALDSIATTTIDSGSLPVLA